MKFINSLIFLTSISVAAAAPTAKGNMEKRECDYDGQARCILACNVSCVAAGPAGMAACMQGCNPQCGPANGC
ncbi:hypothetical protein ACHAPJ_010140 [Fusarium lateritium]